MLIILLKKPRLDDELLLFIKETIKIIYLHCLAIHSIPALIRTNSFYITYQMALFCQTAMYTYDNM